MTKCPMVKNIFVIGNQHLENTLFIFSLNAAHAIVHVDLVCAKQ